MGQDRYQLDVPVLLEVRHALDQAGENAPTELVGTAQRSAEFRSDFPQPLDGGELNLLLRLPGSRASSSRRRFSSSERLRRSLNGMSLCCSLR